MNIGYYAHSHGTGHCRQADKLAGVWASLHCDRTEQNSVKIMTVFTSLADDAYQFKSVSNQHVVRLANEHECEQDVLAGRAGQYWKPQCLHYSPVGNMDILQRSHVVLSQILARNIELMIVDVSVEVALLCRTVSMPYLYVRLPGNRSDTPHLEAFRGAIGLLAAYPKELEATDTPTWVRQKTVYLGFLSSKSLSKIHKRAQLDPLTLKLNFLSQLKLQTKGAAFNQKLTQLINSTDNELSLTDPLATEPNAQIVTIIKGFGGHANIDNKIATLRKLLPNALIISLGPIEDSVIEYVDIAMTVADVSPFLEFSDLLVMACGLNAIGEACQFDTPLLVMPDERPHAEQQKMAEALIKCGRGIDLARLNQLICRDGAVSHNGNIFAECKPGPSLTDTLRKNETQGFISSIYQAKDVKSWFYKWLLPQLDIKPNLIP